MSESGVLAEFMDLMSQEGISDNKLRKILAYVERLLSGQIMINYAAPLMRSVKPLTDLFSAGTKFQKQSLNSC